MGPVPSPALTLALPSEKHREAPHPQFSLDAQILLFLPHLHRASLQAHDLSSAVLIISTLCLSSTKVLFISTAVIVYECSCCNREGYENSSLGEAGNPVAGAWFKVAEVWRRGSILGGFYALEIVYFHSL